MNLRKQEHKLGWIILLIVVVFFIVMSVSRLARGAEPDEPQAIEDRQTQRLGFCLTAGARAAWGAEARFAGAPLHFKYVPIEGPGGLREMFMKGAVPPDSVYVGDVLLEAGNETLRKEYEEMASFGWKQADHWIDNGVKEDPGFEFLTGLFANDCMEAQKNLIDTENETK